MFKIFRTLTVFLSMTPLLFSNASYSEDRKVPEWKQKSYEQHQKAMGSYDLNGDGVLKNQEIQGSIEQKFDKADADNDNQISEREAKKVLKDYKRNNDEAYGEPTKQGAKQLEHRLQDMDRDQDDNISAGEYNSYQARRTRRMDRNSDGQISPGEYRTDAEAVPKRRRSYNLVQ